jgi:hypothetical protein
VQRASFWLGQRVDDDLNIYAYVGNGPLDKTDPSGERCAKNGSLGALPAFGSDPKSPSSASERFAIASQMMLQGRVGLKK